MPRVPALIVIVVLVEWVSCLPAKIPSTSLNLPIDEAVAKGNNVEAPIADTPNDHSKVETPFKEPRVQEFLHSRISDFLNPTPIVDGLKEEDKYGNVGDRLEPVNSLIVRGTEVASQFVGNVASYPRQLLVTASGRVSAALGRFGGALVGL